MIWIERNGKIAVIADPPDLCSAGHAEVIQGWGPCPGCRGPYMVIWICHQEGCGEVVVPAEHACTEQWGKPARW